MTVSGSGVAAELAPQAEPGQPGRLRGLPRAAHDSPASLVVEAPAPVDLQQEKSHPLGSEPDRSLVCEMVTVTEAPYEVSIAQGNLVGRG